MAEEGIKENYSWLMRYLEDAKEQAAMFPKWTREVSTAIDVYYGRNAPSGPARVRNCDRSEELSVVRE